MGRTGSPIFLWIACIYLLVGLSVEASPAVESGVRVFSGYDWEVLGANETYDVAAVFVPGQEYGVECSCGCEWAAYTHSGVAAEIPVGRFVRFRVWNMCFERNLVVVRAPVERGLLTDVINGVVEFLAGWPRLIASAAGLVSFCMYMRMTPVEMVRDLMYLEPIPGGR